MPLTLTIPNSCLKLSRSNRRLKHSRRQTHVSNSHHAKLMSQTLTLPNSCLKLMSHLMSQTKVSNYQPVKLTSQTHVPNSWLKPSPRQTQVSPNSCLRLSHRQTRVSNSRLKLSHHQTRVSNSPCQTHVSKSHLKLSLRLKVSPATPGWWKTLQQLWTACHLNAYREIGSPHPVGNIHDTMNEKTFISVP